MKLTFFIQDFKTKLFKVLSILFDDQNHNEIYYIGNSEYLPEPLTKEEEEELLKKFEAGNDEESRNTLIEKNLRLVIYIAKKFENTGINLEDLISIGSIGLIKAINTFKLDKNIKLATYASKCIENEILMYIRKNAKSRFEVPIDTPLNTDWDGNELLLSDIIGTDEDIIFKDLNRDVENKILNSILVKLNDREKEIITLRFGLSTRENELTQKEVAEYLGISQSYISRLEKKIMRRLRKDLSKMY